ncbi:MAG: hypothetical protein M1816_007860 [Peltula sp. TS41687]|nr:MAG: hypothetical protein M1816_007860 [Peltula sp. TS41687]
MPLRVEMRFFTRAFGLVSVTLITSLVLSPSTAIPHVGRHHRRAHGYGHGVVSAAAAHSGTGLRFNNIEGNQTNHDLYLLPVQESQLALPAGTASPDTVDGSTATAIVNVSTGLSDHMNSSSVYNNGRASQTPCSDGSSAFIMQPHLRVHHTAHATVNPEMHNLGYAATVSSSAQAESSPTSGVAATLVYRDQVDLLQSSSTAVAWQPALFYTFHLPKVEALASPDLPSLNIKRKTRTIVKTATISRPAPSVTQMPPSTTSETAQIQTSASDQFFNGGYESFRAPMPQSSESQSQATSGTVQSSTTSPIEIQLSTVTSSAYIPEVISSTYTTSTESSTTPAYSDMPTSSTTQSAGDDDVSTTTVTSETTPVFTRTVTSESSPAPAYGEAPSSVSLSSEIPSSTTASSAYTDSTVVPPPPMSYAEGSSIIQPRALTQKLHGISSNEPSSQYIKMERTPNYELPNDLLVVGINNALSTSYGIAPDTGSIPINDTTKPLITDLKGRPHLSRDGGKGGYLNGQKLFLFCDTGSYTQPSKEKYGEFLGFVSSSAAIDKGMKGADGEALILEDGIGEWSDDVGRMRGFSPLTEGEQSYNLAMQGKGQRYAIWPESSLIPLNNTHAIMYAPIVYTEVNWVTRNAVFTYSGSTLLSITTGPGASPHAVRLVDKMFQQEKVEWGTIAGFRSYGRSGPGGNDGRVYVIGKVQWGYFSVELMSAKLPIEYEYWNGDNWTKDMPDRSSKAYFLPGPYMDGDLIYSPAHLTFIWVYLNPFADNTFYFRYLLADTAIRPAGASTATAATAAGSYYHPTSGADDSNGDDDDFAENLVRYPWSKEQVLYKADGGPTGKYIYAGGVHQGYFDEHDIANGGKMMLLSWTVPTGDNPAAEVSEYLHITAHVEFV